MPFKNWTPNKFFLLLCGNLLFMTSIGFTILDAFSQCLENHERLISPRNTNILQRLYDWEETRFATESEIARELDITAQRVRSIRQQSLQKLRAYLERSHYAEKTIRILDNYALKEEQNSRHKTIVRFWFNELKEFPGLSIVTLLAGLYLNTNQEVLIAVEHYRSLQGLLGPHELSKRAHLKRTYSNQHHLKEQLMRNIIWFNYVRLWKEDTLNDKKPKRNVNRSNYYYSGEIFSNKCQRNIQYESDVELDFIQKLEANNTVRSFLEQPVHIPFNENGKPSQYTPDFAILLTDGRFLIAEIKSSCEEMLDAALHQKMEALIDFCEKNGFGLLLTNGKRSLNYLFHYPCKPGLEEALQSRLNECGDEALSRIECESILRSYQANKDQLLSLVSKNNWGLHRSPFRLTSKNSFNMFREKIIQRLPGFMRPSR
jgi:hypothetical protein